jgi:hypothetical protein
MRLLDLPSGPVAVLAPDAHGIPGRLADILPFPLTTARRHPYVRVTRASQHNQQPKGRTANGQESHC